MKRVEAKPRACACVGVITGVVLLLFAAVLAVSSSREIEAVVPSPVRRFRVVEERAPARRLADATTTTTATVNNATVNNGNGTNGTAAVAAAATNSTTTAAVSSGSSSLAGSSSVTSFTGSSVASSGTGGNKAVAYMKQGSVGQLVQLILFLAYGYFYKQKVVDAMGTPPVLPPRPQREREYADFAFNLVDCLFDCDMCLMVTFCPAVRAAHTNDMIGTCGFWQSLAALWCSAWMCGLGPCCLTVYWRMQIKDHMNVDDNCLKDALAAFFCMPCVTGQHAMSVDNAAGWSFSCPFELEHLQEEAPATQEEKQGLKTGWF